VIKNYNWNIRQWLGRFLERGRRGEQMVAFIWSLLAPLQDIADDFAAKAHFWRSNVIYNSQQGVLQSALNSLFDATDRRIRVVTLGDLFPDITLYYDNELEPREVIVSFDGEDFEAPVIYHDSETDGQADYIVFVPTELSALEAQIVAYVNRYNLADKTFLIEYE
jgi:hypothetical protein